MNTGQYTAQPPQSPVRPGEGPDRLLPGQYYWGARARERLLLGLVFVPEQRIEVDLWWHRLNGAPEIRLCFGLYPQSVEFGELSGNGFDHPQFHHRGFGTLVVNTAIQALQASCAPATPIEGALSNLAEQRLAPEERGLLAQQRRDFWRRFGAEFYALEGSEELHLCGSVGALVILRDGMVAGQFPRFVPLTAFSRARPKLATGPLHQAVTRPIAATRDTG